MHVRPATPSAPEPARGGRVQLDDLTQAQLDALYDELDAAHTELAGRDEEARTFRKQADTAQRCASRHQAQLAAIREYIETSDDDGIRTRETVLHLLDSEEPDGR